MTPHRWSPAVLVMLTLVVPVAAAPEIGDKPPAIQIAEWVGAKPTVMPGAADADKHVFVIDFWATWLPKCAESTARLADLQRKHEKDGLIVIGISNQDPADVKAFVKKAKLPYAVGCEEEMATSEEWMEGVKEIPYAYVIDRAGVIVWRGDSAENAEALAKAVEDVLAGKFDATAAKQAVTADEKFRRLQAELQTAYAMEDKDKVFDLLDQMIALKPLELQPYLIKRQALAHFDMAEKMPEWEEKILRAFHDDVAGLKRFVQIELERDIAERSPSVMMRAARRAAEVAEKDDAEALVLLARVQCELSMIDAAVATQKEAVSRATGEKKDYYRKVLKYYQAVREVGTETATTKKSRPTDKESTPTNKKTTPTDKKSTTTRPSSRPAKGD